MSNSFYVYLHVRKSDNIVFYVGKGRGRRATYFNERNDHWTKTYNKHGCRVEYVAKNITEDAAFALERETIKKHQSEKLCNMTDGGEGVSGYRFTPEQIKRLSDSHIGYKVKEETKRRLSIAHMGRKNSPSVRKHIRNRMMGNDYGKNRVITQELRGRLREVNLGENNPNAIHTEYNFVNKDGRTYTGTRYNLKRDTGDCVRALFYTVPNKSIYGWSLAE